LESLRSANSPQNGQFKLRPRCTPEALDQALCSNVNLAQGIDSILCSNLNYLIYVFCSDNLNDSDIEGGEEGVDKVEDDVKITPFNMREELEEGHFDKDGLYHWNKETDIKDNWLDNIDWVKVSYLNTNL